MKGINSPQILISLLAASQAYAQQLPQDPGADGPQLEVVHQYFDEWPTGITVSSEGRLFSNYPSGLDPMNTRYQVAELSANNTETPYPSAEINSPPGGAVNYTTYPATSANYPDYFIGVQSVVVDPKNRLWVLDTGRAALPNGTLTYSVFGGPKLIGIDLSSNSIIKTILFPADVAYPDSYPNDVRFDLRSSVTASGEGIAYITDSSSEGRNGIIIVDLGSGESWRHLENIQQVRPAPGFYANIWGESFYMSNGVQPIARVAFGVDGITLSNDGETLYFSVVPDRHLYSVPTSRLRDRSSSSELFATGSIMDLGEKGVSDGLESDSNGLVYAGSCETNSIVFFNPENGTVQTHVRDPRMGWIDTLAVSTDGNIYFTANQLWRGAAYQGGMDKRVKPYVLFKVATQGGGSKINLQ